MSAVPKSRPKSEGYTLQIECMKKSSAVEGDQPNQLYRCIFQYAGGEKKEIEVSKFTDAVVLSRNVENIVRKVFGDEVELREEIQLKNSKARRAINAGDYRMFWLEVAKEVESRLKSALIPPKSDDSSSDSSDSEYYDSDDEDFSILLLTDKAHFNDFVTPKESDRKNDAIFVCKSPGQVFTTFRKQEAMDLIKSDIEFDYLVDNLVKEFERGWKKGCAFSEEVANALQHLFEPFLKEKSCVSIFMKKYFKSSPFIAKYKLLRQNFTSFPPYSDYNTLSLSIYEQPMDLLKGVQKRDMEEIRKEFIEILRANTRIIKDEVNVDDKFWDAMEKTKLDVSPCVDKASVFLFESLKGLKIADS